jgi:hypothetical protein
MDADLILSNPNHPYFRLYFDVIGLHILSFSILIYQTTPSNLTLLLKVSQKSNTLILQNLALVIDIISDTE